MTVGQIRRIVFGEAYDFESNKVRLEFAELHSEDLQVDRTWLNIANNTKFDEIILTVFVPEDIEIPKDEKQVELILDIIIADNHVRLPM